MSSEWLTAAQEELDKFRAARASHPRLQKMVNTLIALVDARLSGAAETSVFGRPDTCGQRIYYGKWKHDQAFAEALEGMTALARKWHDGRELRALEKARERLALGSEAAATKLVAKLASEDDGIVIRAATAILDRAGVQTSVKQTQVIPLKDIDVSKLTAEQIARIRAGEDPMKVLLAPYMIADGGEG